MAIHYKLSENPFSKPLSYYARVLKEATVTDEDFIQYMVEKYKECKPGEVRHWLTGFKDFITKSLLDGKNINLADFLRITSAIQGIFNLTDNRPDFKKRHTYKVHCLINPAFVKAIRKQAAFIQEDPYLIQPEIRRISFGQSGDNIIHRKLANTIIGKAFNPVSYELSAIYITNPLTKENFTVDSGDVHVSFFSAKKFIFMFINPPFPLWLENNLKISISIVFKHKSWGQPIQTYYFNTIWVE